MKVSPQCAAVVKTTGFRVGFIRKGIENKVANIAVPRQRHVAWPPLESSAQSCSPYLRRTLQSWQKCVGGNHFLQEERLKRAGPFS